MVSFLNVLLTDIDGFEIWIKKEYQYLEFDFNLHYSYLEEFISS